ncbi:MAG: hypothetical protein U0234_10635 [Sandaracinus sp.]
MGSIQMCTFTLDRYLFGVDVRQVQEVLRALESTPDEDAEAEQKRAEHHASEHTITHGELARARASELSRRPATSGPVLASAALHPARARRHG